MLEDKFEFFIQSKEENESGKCSNKCSDVCSIKYCVNCLKTGGSSTYIMRTWAELCPFLNITPQKFFSILYEHGAVIKNYTVNDVELRDVTGYYYFENKKSAIRAMEVLESLYIMQKLCS